MSNVRELHVVPTADLIEHDLTSLVCACGPTVHATQRHENGAMYWATLVTHHALDGRA